MDSIHNEHIEYELIFRSSSFEEYKYPEYKVVDKIKGFSHLPNGWDFGHGESPSADVITQAIAIYQSGLLLGFKGDARPETKGGVILNLFTGDDFVYITINSNGQFDIRHEKGIGADYEILDDRQNVSLNRIYKTLQNLTNKCILSEPYMSISTTQIVEDFQVIALNDMEEEFQYL